MSVTNGNVGHAERALLIVDDDDDFAAALLESLQCYDYQVEVVSSAETARQALARRPVGAALIDVRLRRSSGIDLVEDLRRLQPGILCIMMTAYATADTAISAIHLGAYDFLRKPFHPDELLATLSRAFERLELAREKALTERSLERYRQIVASTSDLMAFVDGNYRYVAVNDAYTRAYGRRAEEMVGAHVRSVHGEAIFASHLQPALNKALGGTEVRLQLWLDVPHGGRQFIDAALYPHKAAEPSDDGVVISLRDITETQRLSEQLSFEASHDVLTGLVNRREFEERLKHLIDVARRDRSEHAFCYIDLDQFKVVNDTCGHVAGDELLRQIGSLLPRETRAGDTVARLGGDEFGVLMSGCTLAQATRVANALLRAVSELAFRWDNKSFKIGASMGLVSITADNESAAQVLSLADRACYRAKDSGRNRIHVYVEGDAELARSHGEMQWVARLEAALSEDRFRLDRQTIMSLRGTEPAGERFELLLRMVDETGAVISPGAFLPAAERFNLASRLDRWVCEHAFAWLRAHPSHLADLQMVSINLSASSLGDEPFCEFLHEALAGDELLATRICLEITETAAIMNLSRAMSFMERLKACGCRFALDDFGSGFSSFAYLKSLPVDYIKIDGQFVKDIAGDRVDLAMVRAINEVGQVMGKQTIAEFVESEAIIERLREVGVDFAQGYHIERPRPLEQARR